MGKDRYEQMINGNVKGLVLKLAFPTVISMLITSIYNIVDTFFVSQISTSSSAAISVVFSLQSLIQAVGFTLGMGCGALVSRLLGEQNKEKADEVASSTFALGILFGTLLMIIGLFFTKELMYLLGATSTSVEYAVEYARFIFLATPLMIPCFIMNNILRSEGHASLSMIGLAIGGILNMGLDPLFMFTFNMGVSGAGLSTMASQIISFLVLISVFAFHKTSTGLSIKKISKDVKLYLTVVKTGSPTLFRQGCASFANIILNFLAHPYGDACIAALGICNKIYHFVRGIVVGCGQGFQPVLGYNYGAKRNDRIKEGMLFTCMLTTSLSIICAIIILIFPEQLVRLFRDDTDVINIGKIAIRLLSLSLPFLGFSTIVNQGLQVTGHSKSASFLASLRQGIIFIPLVYLLAFTLKDFGLCLTQPLSDLLTAIISIPFLFYFLNELKKNKEVFNADE